MTIYGRSVELVSRCVECDLAEPEPLTSLGGSAPGVVEGILSEIVGLIGIFSRLILNLDLELENLILGLVLDFITWNGT